MVAKVISGKDIQGALNYNEQKVLQGTAYCIQASGFLQDANELTFYDKLERFQALNEKNLRTTTNTLHISLNFDVTEQLSKDEFNSIASTYLNKIGFGNQPYVVYQHTDAAHPHVHIVTTIIQEDGKRIPIHNIGRNQSEKARKEIELEFGLVRAESKKKETAEFIRPVDLKKAVYGKSETKRSIVNIVRSVTREYKYSSLPELNAVLRQYNVTADRGSEKSKMFQKGGLLYSLVDDNGKRVGIPVKASAIPGKPTLAFLEKQFKLNAALRQPHRDSLKNTIDRVLNAPGMNKKVQFSEALDKSGVTVNFRTNPEGRTYGVTFIDNRSRTVFNGSDLGKAYSAGSILQRLVLNEDTVKRYERNDTHSNIEVVKTVDSPVLEMIRDLVTAENFDPTSPDAALKLKRNRKKRKRRF